MNDLFISSAILIVLLLIALFGLKVMNIERTIGKIIVLLSLSVGYAFTLGDVLTFNDENMPILNMNTWGNYETTNDFCWKILT